VAKKSIRIKNYYLTKSINLRNFIDNDVIQKMADRLGWLEISIQNITTTKNCSEKTKIKIIRI